MGGRALGAVLAAAAQAFWLAVLIAGPACAEVPAADEPAGLAAAPLAPAAGDDQNSEFTAPASAVEDEAPVGPADAPAGDLARDPADATDTAAAVPNERDRKPTDTAAIGPNGTEQPPEPTASPAPAPGEPPPTETAATNPDESAPASSPSPTEATTPPVAGEETAAVVAAIKSKLQDPAIRKSAAADDLAALEAFYAEHGDAPLWITTMGFSAKAQAIIAEIQKAGDWGLDPDAFDLPASSDLPPTTEAQVIDELKLDLAVLKYARFARGGRLSPARISLLFDQKPNLLDPKAVLAEIAASSSPGAYLISLQPKHDQFKSLRQALVRAIAASKARGRKPDADPAVQRLIVNMERWRWMPAELGSYYVWDNIPSYTARVIKDGKSIYVEKAIVGQLKYATPIFSADMRSIVFNPDWTVPDTIKIEDLQPRLRQPDGSGPDLSVLRDNQLSVSYQGRPIDAATVDWGRANILSYTFTQKPGPDNVLGVLKFNFPNRHAIYMHDTVQPELFKETERALSHGCIRVHQPGRLAALLLAEDKGWSEDKVKDLLAKGSNTGVVLTRPVPVHLTYFTLAFDGVGRLRTYEDIYGIDKKMAAALFGKAETLSTEDTAALPTGPRPKKRSAWNSGLSGTLNSIPGLFGN
jgi:murein L,D-transpeptidase YcbB/YkuD